MYSDKFPLDYLMGFKWEGGFWIWGMGSGNLGKGLYCSIMTVSRLETGLRHEASVNVRNKTYIHMYRCIHTCIQIPFIRLVQGYWWVVQ